MANSKNELDNSPTSKAAAQATTIAPTTTQRTNATNQVKHSTLFHISHNLFCNKRLKRKRIKLALAIRKGILINSKGYSRKNNGIKNINYRRMKHNLSTIQPEVTINLLSDDEEIESIHNNTIASFKTPPSKEHLQSSPKHLVFPVQLSKVPNITLIPMQKLQAELASSLQKRLKCKRKSQKPKRHAEPTIVNNESIVLSDDSGEETKTPAACSTPTVESFNVTNHNSSLKLEICSGHTARTAQVDEEVTVSLVPRCSAAGSCSSKASNSSDIFPVVPDETTVQTVISNRLYELSLTKLREGLATSGATEFADDKGAMSSSTRRKGNFNLPPKLNQSPPQPVSLKLSSDLSISLISDDEEDQEQQRLTAEKLLREQPHLSVRPVSVATLHQPPKRRKLG